MANYAKNSSFIANLRGFKECSLHFLKKRHDINELSPNLVFIVMGLTIYTFSNYNDAI